MAEFAQGGYVPLPGGRDTIPVPFDPECERIISAADARRYGAALTEHLWSQTPEAVEFLKRRSDTFRNDGPDA